MAAINVSQVKSILVSTIMDNTNINSIILGRVYPAHIATIEAPTYPCIAFVFTPLGEMNDDIRRFSKVIDQSVGFYFYGESRKGYEVPHNLHRYLVDLIHMQRINSTTFGINVICKKLEEPNEAVDPVENIPYIYNRWSLTAVKN